VAGITEPWRNEIADGFEGWSLGHQETDLARLGQLPVPGVWMTGGDDRKFCALAQSTMAILPKFEFQTIPRAGHRLLSETPHAIQSCLKELAG
jgi:2-succinyl-6-hydroxy-2,4-cyclohexadiene-1-carboxylate synthase